MPLAVRTIEPIYLGRRPLREEEKGKEEVQVAIAQNAVLGALVQLASLVRHADDLFCDLADECQSVFEKTERIIHRVKKIKEGVGRLDPKKVAIPVGDLKRFSAVQDHHVAKHGFECAFFTPDLRPHSIKAHYSLCEVTPVGALRGADQYRKDGLRSSDLFKFWPIVLKEHQIKTPDMNLPRKQGQAVTFNKKYKRLTPRPKTIHGVDSLDIGQQSENKNELSTSAALDQMSKSQPSILIAVDTSGTGFYRMSSFRQSLKETASLDRKKRRRTVSGVPDNIMREIEVFERGKRNPRSTPRNYSFDDLDAKKMQEKDQTMMQYFDELYAKMEEKTEQEQANREPKLFKFLPCRRSRSLPRCVKIESNQCSGIMTFEQDENSKDKIVTSTTSGYASSSLSLGSTGGSSTSSRATKRSSIIGSKIKSFVTGTLRPRPKSLDFDSIDVLGNDADAEDDSSSSTHSKVNLTRKFSPSMPDDISSLSSSRESKVGPGTYYYFTNSTLPRAQARKYDFPWDSLPKDWTTAVKLREISKRRKEERNSSSGNWSGSSNRQSLDSARSSAIPSSTSQHSLGRDSGRDSPSLGDEKDMDNESEQSATNSGTSTFMSLNIKNTIDSDTEQWLASLAQRAAAREDAAEGDVTESLTRLSQLTKQNIQALEDTFSPGTQRPMRLDDEVSSVYSLDQDGFYTSFHNDSGLRRSTGTLLDDGALTPLKETHSTLSVESNNTVDSVIFVPFGAATPGKTDMAIRSVGKVRPPPPVRAGSRLSSSRLSEKEGKNMSMDGRHTATDVSDATVFLNSVEPSTSSESPQSESDQETIYARLKVKTKISSRSIPSWCLISDEESTDSSSACLAGANSKTSASILLSGSKFCDSAMLESSNPSTVSTPVGSDVWDKEEPVPPWNCSTLPRQYLESKMWEEDLVDQSNSWPRSRRCQQQPISGILKRDKSPAGSMKPKILNFAPVVNMFDHNTSKGIELPLQAAFSNSSSSSIDCSSDSSTVGLTYDVFQAKASLCSDQVDKPFLAVKTDKDGPCLRMNSRIVSPHPLLKASSGPLSQHQEASQHGDTREISSSSVSGSDSSLPSLSDCGHGKYLDMSASLGHYSPDTFSSSSSAGLSDIDSSLTYVSMSSHNSTPTNSTLALCSDDSSTPVNSPVLERNRHKILPVVSQNPSDQNKHALTKNFIKDRGPVLQAPAKQTSAQGSKGNKTFCIADRQLLGSFAADASTEAAPASWIGERLNSRTLSDDSGFSSPTTPTTSVKGHCQQAGIPHTANTTLHYNPQVHEAQVHSADVFHIDDESLDRKVRTAVPPSELSVGHKHELLRTLQSSDFSSSQPSTPRSNSYRAATDLEKPFSLTRKSDDGSVRPKMSSLSSSQLTNPRSPLSHSQMPKSISCPTGVMADIDPVTRADSYRVAVRNTQGVVGEIATRNSSYRMATGEDDTVPNACMDAINSWHGSHKAGSRDIRRMGITDIDQLKCYDSDSSSSKTSSSSLNGKSSSKSFAGINSSRKKMRPEVQNLLRGDKTPSPEVKRMSKVSRKNGKGKARTQSSTYIRFDPIFEQGDDMSLSSDTLRAESIEMITSENGFLMSDKIVGKLPPGQVKSAGTRKNVEEKTVMSIFDTIKTTIKSMSGKNSSDKDMWRYEGGI